MPFPSQVNVAQAPAVAGDFASANPRAFVFSGPGALVAGASGVTVGRFAWNDPGGQGIVSNTGNGSVMGFVHREQQALLTTYLAEASNLIPPGFGITLAVAGDFWIINSGTTECKVGQKAYAKYADGTATFAATATATTGTVATSAIAAGTAISVTGSITGNVLTVTAVSTGTVYPGAILTGGGTATGTQVTSQLTGTGVGGIGTYMVSIPDQAVTSTTISGSYGVLTLGADPSATIPIGAILSGSSVSSGTVVWSLLTGAGTNGSTYVVSPTSSASSTTITFTSNVETKWIAMSTGPAGGLVKISSWPLG